MKTIVSAGEACSSEIVARWAPGRRFVNAYGPTEATVCTTMIILEDGERVPPIGQPINNFQVMVLDANQHPLPQGMSVRQPARRFCRFAPPQQQYRQDAGKGQRIDGKGDPNAGHGDQDSAQRRSNRASKIETHAAQRHRPRDLSVWHQRRHGRLPGQHMHHRSQSEHEGQTEQRPGIDDSRERQ